MYHPHDSNRRRAGAPANGVTNTSSNFFGPGGHKSRLADPWSGVKTIFAAGPAAIQPVVHSRPRLSQGVAR